MAVISDPVSSVRTLLTSNWSSGNTDDTTPTISDSWDLGKKNLNRGDVIRLYEVAGTHEPNAFGSGLDKGSWRISIDISTKSSRSRLRKLYGEVLRLLRANKTDPFTDYQMVYPTSRVDQTDKLNRWYRYVLDCEVVSYEVT